MTRLIHELATYIDQADWLDKLALGTLTGVCLLVITLEIIDLF